MRPIEIEAWVLRVADQLENGVHSEDSRVELKAKWPEAKGAARRIAAHANAARGSEILWIIGLDEKSGPCDPGSVEVADWFAAVRPQFDTVYPEMMDINVRVGEHTVVALLFSTDRAPYLVKNALYGTSGERVELEVPWREGCSTRTARRHELLRLLAPLTTVPELEGLMCDLSLGDEWTDGAVQNHRWLLQGSLYVLPTSRDQVVIPFHRCKVRLDLASGRTIEKWKQFELSAPRRLGIDPGQFITTVSDSRTIDATGAELIVFGPGRVDFLVSVLVSSTEEIPSGSVAATLYLEVAGAAMPAICSFTLSRCETTSGARAQWRYEAGST